MSRDEALLGRVKAALARIRPVEERRMFGGITFMVRGQMCVSVGADRIMCRIDPAAHDAAVARKGATTVFMKGREYRGYVYVDGYWDYPLQQRGLLLWRERIRQGGRQFWFPQTF